MKLHSKITAATALTSLTLLFGAGTVQAEEWQAHTVDDIKVEENATEYVVEYGDTLGVISKALGIDLEVIISENGISNPDLIFPGDVCTITTGSNGDVSEISLENETETITYDTTTEDVEVEQHVEEPLEQHVEEPAEQTPVQEPIQEPIPEPIPETTQSTGNNVSPHADYNSNPTTTGAEYEAKEWIAQKESNGSYTAVNGQYYGRYQLNPTLVHHGASPAEQEAAADIYVMDRYGSWSNAQAFWMQNGWY